MQIRKIFKIVFLLVLILWHGDAWPSCSNVVANVSEIVRLDPEATDNEIYLSLRDRAKSPRAKALAKLATGKLKTERELGIFLEVLRPAIDEALKNSRQEQPKLTGKFLLDEVGRRVAVPSALLIEIIPWVLLEFPSLSGSEMAPVIQNRLADIDDRLIESPGDVKSSGRALALRIYDDLLSVEANKNLSLSELVSPMDGDLRQLLIRVGVVLEAELHLRSSRYLHNEDEIQASRSWYREILIQLLPEVLRSEISANGLAISDIHTAKLQVARIVENLFQLAGRSPQQQVSFQKIVDAHYVELKDLKQREFLLAAHPILMKYIFELAESVSPTFSGQVEIVEKLSFKVYRSQKTRRVLLDAIRAEVARASNPKDARVHEHLLASVKPVISAVLETRERNRSGVENDFSGMFENIRQGLNAREVTIFDLIVPRFISRAHTRAEASIRRSSDPASLRDLKAKIISEELESLRLVLPDLIQELALDYLLFDNPTGKFLYERAVQRMELISLDPKFKDELWIRHSIPSPSVETYVWLIDRLGFRPGFLSMNDFSVRYSYFLNRVDVLAEESIQRDAARLAHLSPSSTRPSRVSTWAEDFLKRLSDTDREILVAWLRIPESERLSSLPESTPSVDARLASILEGWVNFMTEREGRSWGSNWLPSMYFQSRSSELSAEQIKLFLSKMIGKSLESEFLLLSLFQEFQHYRRVSRQEVRAVLILLHPQARIILRELQSEVSIDEWLGLREDLKMFADKFIAYAASRHAELLSFLLGHQHWWILYFDDEVEAEPDLDWLGD